MSWGGTSRSFVPIYFITRGGLHFRRLDRVAGYDSISFLSALRTCRFEIDSRLKTPPGCYEILSRVCINAIPRVLVPQANQNRSKKLFPSEKKNDTKRSSRFASKKGGKPVN